MDPLDDFGKAAAKVLSRTIDEEIIASVLGEPSPMELRQKERIIQEAKQKELQKICIHKFRIEEHWDQHEQFHGYSRVCDKCELSESWGHAPAPGWER